MTSFVLRFLMKSYDEIFRPLRDFFNAQTTNGFVLDQTFQINPNTSLYTSFQFYPLSFKIFKNQFGIDQLFRTKSRVFQSVLDYSFPNGHIDITYGERKLIQAEFSPMDAGKIGIAASYLSNSIGMKIFSSFRSELFNYHAEINKNIGTQDTNFRLTGSLGIPEACFGYQISNPSSYINYIFSIAQTSGRNHVLAEYSREQNRDFFVLRYTRDHNKSLSIGGGFQISQELIPVFGLAWKTKINKHMIHSSITSTGMIKTQMITPVSKICKCITSGSIDHRTAEYNYGLTLSFEPPEQK